MDEITEELIRLSVPVRQNACARIVEELKKLTSSSLDSKEKVLQASKLIFGLNLRHVCIYKIEGRQVTPVSQYGCDHKRPFNYDEQKGWISPAIISTHPRVVQLLPEDSAGVSAQLPETKSGFVVPIKNTKGEVIGILELLSSIWYDFRVEEFRDYVALAEQLSELVEQQRQ